MPVKDKYVCEDTGDDCIVGWTLDDDYGCPGFADCIPYVDPLYADNKYGVPNDELCVRFEAPRFLKFVN